MAFTPFAFMKSGRTNVIYNVEQNFWGDKPENLEWLIEQAHLKGLKVLIKPHIWVHGEGWPGDFTPGNGKWKIWQENYTKHIISLAKLCEKQGVEMFCIGVEFKNAVNVKPKYWELLIKQVRSVYSGKVIYAANWDNYYRIPFWHLLDYVAIDGYFPLVNAKTPEVKHLNLAWQPVIKQLAAFSKKHNKGIIFTEYGYRSIDGTAFKQWIIENKGNKENINMQAQENAYTAFYKSVWNKPWFEGGFIWRWFIEPNNGGLNNSNYTPQNKPVQKTILEWYSK